MSPRKKVLPAEVIQEPVQVPADVSPRRSFMPASPRIRLLAAALAVIGVGGVSYYFYTHAQQAPNPQKAAEREVELYVGRIGKLMLLPENEVPIVATVADPEKLRGQDFFVNAKKGDKILLYNGARKAILYDPVADKIINVAPLADNGKTASPLTQ